MSGRPRPRPGLSARGRMPRPSSRTTTRSMPSVDGRAQRDRALAAGIGVDDDVRARLGDGELDVRQRLVRDVEHVGESADRVARHGDVLRAGRQRELEIGCVGFHAAFRGKRSGHAGGTGGDSARPRRVLCMSSHDPPVE